MDKQEVLRNQALLEGLAVQIDVCRTDLGNAVCRGRLALEEQVRAYDLLNRLLEMGKETLEYADITLGASIYHFQRAYAENAGSFADIVDTSSMEQEAENILTTIQKDMNDARFAAASAESLHEFAKEVFDIWQTQGIFARKRALKELRARAGFRLESHRIGNYVAKTFDLKNEAQTRFARTQQEFFASDVRYKIKSDTYEQIMSFLNTQMRILVGEEYEGCIAFCGVKYAEYLEGDVSQMPLWNYENAKKEIWP